MQFKLLISKDRIEKEKIGAKIWKSSCLGESFAGAETRLWSGSKAGKPKMRLRKSKEASAGEKGGKEDTGVAESQTA